MSTSKEYIEFVLEQLGEISDVTYKKMLWNIWFMSRENRYCLFATTVLW